MSRSVRQVAASLVTTLICVSPSATAATGGGADGEFSKRRSLHFVLHQDVGIDNYTGWNGSRRFEQRVLDVLEDAYREVRGSLGVAPPRAVQVVVWDPELFERQYGGLFLFQAAGFYDGVIHVRGATKVSADLTATLHHEFVHATLDAASLRGRFPGWLNEGIAEYFERLALGRRTPSFGEYAALRDAHAVGRWIPLAELGRTGFGDLEPERARLAYLESYAAVELLVRRQGADSLGRLLKRITQTNSVDRALQRTYRLDLAELESKLIEGLR